MRGFLRAGQAKVFFTVVFIAVVLCSLSAQEGSRAVPVRSDHYTVLSDAGDGAQVSRELESRFAVYNRLFRFDTANTAFPLQVRVYRNTETYNNYVSARLGEIRPGAVYLHYNQEGRRELVINRLSADEGKILPYQAFVQFLRAFIPNPPSWMREGFAIYFSTLTFNDSGEISYEENLSWLDTVKKLGPNAASAEAILLADKQIFPPDFQSLSWALVSFFLNSGSDDYFRTITESFMVLSPSATAAENSEAVFRRVGLWNSYDSLSGDYKSYIASRKTFAELIEEGQRAYTSGDKVVAELAFLSALDQKPVHYAPYYYLGLLAYDENNYDMAEQYYHSSIQYGADKALVSYALGVNAASAGRKTDAVNYLRTAAAANPAKYREKAESLIQRLR
ncbi:MAG: hypothetical protein LBN21_08660 [Treponema sp.]|jgi:hypothetical protein|nr:hypothetical protein [Treponema sp.]